MEVVDLSITNPYNHRAHIHPTQPHSSPLIHTLHSEWVDSPSTSPSKMLFARVYETPQKTKSFNFITPVSDKKEVPMVRQDSIPYVYQKTSTVDILWHMLNDVVGKDKMAKFGQYTLRLLIYWANKTEASLSDPQINFTTISARYNDREKKLNLFMNFLKHPQNFVRIIAILVCSVFSSRFAGMVSGLSMYRQFLRFGKSPFRLRKVLAKLLQSTTPGLGLDLSKLRANFANNATLVELAGLYYNIFDESLLLYKLNLLSNKSYRAITVRHEALSWYCDTLLGLYNAYGDFQNLSLKEIELKIQIQVKSRARALSKQILGAGAGTTLDVSDDKDHFALKDVQFRKTNAYLDIYKGLSDFVFNSYTVFNAPLPFATLQIWMGISASSLSIFKLYRETRKKLDGQAT